jgi:hypothetical protein
MVVWLRVALTCAALVPLDALGYRAGETARDVGAEACRPREKCDVVCQKGKACGDSCIAKWKQCHKRRGRACNADEICEDEQSYTGRPRNM